MDLHSSLARLAEGGDVRSARPRLFDLSNSQDRADLEQLLGDPPAPRVHDTITAQIEDYLRAREPFRSLTCDELLARTGDLLGGLSQAEYGRWVHYPWSHLLVHVLPPREFRALRCDRNRNK